MWPNPLFLADSVTFNEEIFNGKLHFVLTGLYILTTKLGYVTGVSRMRKYIHSQWNQWVSGN